MSNIDSYVCVQGWGEDNVGVEVGSLTAEGDISEILDPEAAANPILGDYSEIVVSGSGENPAFSTSLAYNPLDSAFDGKVTVALLGVRVSPLAQDTVMRANLSVGSETYQSAAQVFGQEMLRTLPSAVTVGHELFGSGVTNIIFHDLPTSVIASSVDFDLALDVGDLTGASIRLGSIFVGLQVPVEVNAQTLRMGFEPMNERFLSRAYVNYSSNGVLHRTFNFDAQRMTHETMTGIGPDFYNSSGIPVPSAFRSSIATIGQPMLFSLYPYPVSGQDWTSTSINVEQRLLSLRQNFWSSYGLFDRSMEVNLEQFREGLDTEYRTRFRFIEVR